MCTHRESLTALRAGNAQGPSVRGGAQFSPECKGGVAIVLRTTLTAEANGGEDRGNAPVEMCCFLIYPTDGRVAQVRVMGVHVPPSRTGRITTRLLQGVVGSSKVGRGWSGAAFGPGRHQDANLGELSDAWRPEAGWWQLDDPGCPTQYRVRMPDRLLMRP